MSSERLPRKLAAILYADVAGYSRLTGDDEDATHRRLRDYLDLIAKTIEDQHGQVMHYAGDAVLAKFDAVVDALSSAVSVQEQLKNRNADLPDERKVQFRIGVNLGDVIEDRGDIYGDGVNVAARLESLADEGGICISESVRTAIGKKLDLGYEFMGEQKVKNIEEPVRAYKVALAAEEKTQVASANKPTLELPDKPSIAVLPFTNMSSDPEQEYFSDGITEDIITELSRFRELFVIARNSSFSYKGKAIKVQDIATNLGVRYVLEGSVRVAGDRIRVTAQLIDAETGHHIWSERYDREITDLFALQDEIAQTVAGAVAGRLKLTAEDRAERKPIENLEAYDYALRGQSIIADTKENNHRARQLYEKAIELDPTLTTAYVGLARSYIIEWFNHWWDPNDHPPDHALEYAAKAVSLDNTDSKAQLILGSALTMKGEHDEAKFHLERALELNPNDADAFALMGTFFQDTCKCQEAIDSYLKAMRLNPYYPAWYVWKLGSAYYDARLYEDALIPLREAIDRNPKFKRARLVLVATYAQLDRIEEARNQVERLLADHPDASMKHERQLKLWGDEEGLEHWLEGLRKAGLPE